MRAEISQRQVHRRQQLAGLVVQLARDVAGLVLAALVETPQRLVGLARSAVGHLEGREAFEQEGLEAVMEGFRSPGRGHAGRERRAPQHHRHVEHAGALRERRAAELVGGAQGLLVPHLEVASQGMTGPLPEPVAIVSHDGTPR